MDPLQEVSSTMTELDTDGSNEIQQVSQQPQNGISLAEAANALITLQVPPKDSAASAPVTIPVSSSRNGGSAGNSLEIKREEVEEVNSKDFRKKILEGMKSQFNTNTEDDVLLPCDPSSRRVPPHRSKSKFKPQDLDAEGEEVAKGESNGRRGRGRPPSPQKKPKLLLHPPLKSAAPSTTPELAVVTRSERDSSSEAGSERSDSTSGSTNTTTATTTRRSQRTNISRTSATDLLKGLSPEARNKKTNDPEMLKPTELPRKRGRPSNKTTPTPSEKELSKTVVAEEEEEDDEDAVSKAEHMASLGLLSKSISDPNLSPTIKKTRTTLEPSSTVKEPQKEPPSIQVMDVSLEKVVDTSLEEDDVEVSIVEDGKERKSTMNEVSSRSATAPVSYACSCTEGRPPVAIAPPAATLYCQAVDSVGGKQVGCCLIAQRKRFYRPSRRIAFMILCDSHRDRIRKHFCCPGCGLFCTQGTFLQCKNVDGAHHFFHADCQRSGQKSCLHCQGESHISEICLQMKTCAVPVFCNDAKLLKTIPTAKISQMPVRDSALNDHSSTDPACPRYLSSQLVLPSGRVIDASGIPASLSKEMLERVINIVDNCNGKGPSNGAGSKNMYLAAKNGDIERVVDCLRLGHNVNMVHQDTHGQTALHAAASEGHLAVVHILIQSGAALDKQDQGQNTPLSLALVHGHNETVKYLVQAGSSSSLKGEGGMTPLHLACKYGNLEGCHYIMTMGNGSKFINAQDDGGWTPLVWGCEHQRVHIVKYLLKCKADPGVRDAEQNVALHWAAYSGSVDIVALLLEHGCQVNAANLHGDTPLHTAGRRDNYECVLLLITRGGRLDLRNKEGQLALEVCPDKHCHSALLLALNTKLQQFTQTPCAEAEKLLTNDITKGKETNPIQCVNGFDDEQPPSDYVYVTDNCFTSPLHVDRTINSLQFCKCSGDCSNNCKCSNLSFRCWYDEEGKLAADFNYADPPMLFECNRACQCHRTSCNNRLVQHGITARLILFRIENKGWGVRTSQPIPKGSYVCEYIGEVITDFEADQREDDSYLFDLDNRDGETYCIDARRYGNIARFINHSCDPNLVPVKMFIDHQDLKFPRIAFFAVRDIDANEELAFDYGDKFWIIKYKSFTCACRSPKCKYSQLTIHRTVEEYHRCLQLQ